MSYSTNFGPAARLIVSGQACNMLGLGDSRFTSAAQPRTRRGIIRTWDVDWRTIWTDNFQASAGDEGIIIYNNPYTGPKFAGQAMSNGQVVPANNPSPVYGVGTARAAAGASAGSLIARYILANATALRGDWLANKNVRFSLAVYGSSESPVTIDVFNLRNGGVINTASLTSSGVTAGTWGLIGTTIPAISNEGEADIRLFFNDGGGTVSARSMNVWAVGYGIDGKTDGFQIDTISDGGWRTLNHLPPDYPGSAFPYDAPRYTDAQLVQRFNTYGWPHVVRVDIGQNVNADEYDGSGNINSTFETRMRAIVARHMNLAAANSKPAPFVVLTTPFQGDSSATRYQQIAAINERIANDTARVAHVNLFAAVNATYGSYATWSGTLLSDGVHQNEAGTVAIERVYWSEVQRAAGTFVGDGMREDFPAGGGLQSYTVTGSPAAALTILPARLADYVNVTINAPAENTTHVGLRIVGYHTPAATPTVVLQLDALPPGGTCSPVLSLADRLARFTKFEVQAWKITSSGSATINAQASV